MEKNKGFTLIELLIVVAIIAILASIIFVALNPLKRFRDSRDAARWHDVNSIADAIKFYQVDNGGVYPSVISTSTISTDEWYMIVEGDMDTGCDDNNSICDVDIGSDSYCVDLTTLVDDGYLGEVPISQSAVVDWDSGSSNGYIGTGYALKLNDNGTVTIQSCESEGTPYIKILK